MASRPATPRTRRRPRRCRVPLPARLLSSSQRRKHRRIHPPRRTIPQMLRTPKVRGRDLGRPRAANARPDCRACLSRRAVMIRPTLDAVSWKGRVMGTDTHLMVITDDAGTGDEDIRRAEEDLHETERVLSRFREGSELSQLNREGSLVADERLL